MDEQQSQFRAIHLHVTEGAQTEMFGGTPLLYVGLSYHIPHEKIEEAQQVYAMTQDLNQAQQVIINVDVSPDELVKRVAEHGYAPVPGAVLERFDTVDSDSGDMLVLLRVPCIPVELPGAQAA